MDKEPPEMPDFLPRLGDDTPEERPQRKWEELFYPQRAPEMPEAYRLQLAEFDRLDAYMRRVSPEDIRYDDALRQREAARVKIMALVDVAKRGMGNGLSPEDRAIAEAAREERYQRDKERLDAEHEAKIAKTREKLRKLREQEELDQAGREGTEAEETEQDRRAASLGKAFREEVEKHGDKVVRLRPVEKEEGTSGGKTKAPRTPVLISALDLWRTPFPDIDWVIEGFLAAGTLSILAGKPKIGKSFLALQAALCVTRGDKFLGLPVPVVGPVWYLGLEDSERRLRHRISGQLGASVPPPATLGVSCWWPRIGKEPDGLDWIKRIIGDIGPPRLIVIDTYARFRARVGSRAGGNMYETQYDDLEPLIEFCAEMGVAILLIHHTNKAGNADVFDRISGSVALQGAVDTMMVLDRQREADELRAQLSVNARDFEGFASELEFEKVPGTWKLIGPAKTVRVTSEQEAVILALRGRGGAADAQTLSDLIEKTLTATRRLCQRMVTAGLLAADVVPGQRTVFRVVD